jgi:two-component sensor histidine kinase
MTIPEEIQQMSGSSAEAADGHAQAGMLLHILRKGVDINNPQSHAYIDQLLALAHNTGTEAYRAWGLAYRAELYRMQCRSAEAIEECRRAIGLFDPIEHRDGIAFSNNVIGNAYNELCNYSEALTHYFAALRLHEELGHRQGAANCYNNIGSVYHYQGNYAEALRTRLLALAIYEEMDNKHGIATCYHNIGMVYTVMDNNTAAHEYFLRELKISTELGYKDRQGGAYNSIGNIYTDQGLYAEGLENFLLALGIYKETDYRIGMAVAYNNIGRCYENKGNYTDALASYTEALRLRIEVDEKRGQAQSYHSIGALYLKQERYEEALCHELRSLEIAEDIGNKQAAKYAALGLTDTYRALGDYESALRYYEKYHKVETELIGEQVMNQLTSLSFQHNLQQVEKSLEIEKDLRKLEEEKNLLLSTQNELIEKTLQERSMLLREIHHRVKNNLQVISSLLEMQSAGIDDAQARSAINEGQNRVRSIALIHNKLYQTEDMTTLEFSSFANDLYRQIVEVYKGLGQAVQTDIQIAETYLDIDTAVPLGLIVNELITNAFKYAFTPDSTGLLSIRLENKQPGAYRLIVKDNGRGLPVGMDIGKVKTLGLRLVSILSRQLGGSSEYHYDQGSFFTIHFIDTTTRKLRD